MKHLLFIFLMTFPIVTFAQSQGKDKLSTTELEDMRAEVAQKVIRLQSLISKIVDKSKSIEDRKIWAKEAAKLFAKNAKIQVTGADNIPRPVPVEDYFYKRIITKYDTQYSYVIIEYNYSAMELSKLQEREDENGNIYYQAVAVVEQSFCGKNAECANERNGCCYADTTTKTVVINIKKVIDYWGERWLVELGDIKVKSTEFK